MAAVAAVDGRDDQSPDGCRNQRAVDGSDETAGRWERRALLGIGVIGPALEEEEASAAAALARRHRPSGHTVRDRVSLLLLLLLMSWLLLLLMMSCCCCYRCW